ncbi:MAG TPA: hypothetical protein VGJ07_11565 [Rugosimonospora sp.]|jgi:hypothetical protein
MGKGIPRILEAAFGAAATLLIVPIAVNVGTGGTAPPWLRHYRGWLWPAALGCVIAIVALEAWGQWSRSRRTISARRPDDPRNDGLALDQVERYVDLRLRGSLAERVRVALALDERPAAVLPPVHLVARVTGSEYRLTAELDVLDVFDEMRESMLILGAPGAGKTTQLLDLAKGLTTRARGAGPDARPAIPVVVDLASYRQRRAVRDDVDAEPRDAQADDSYTSPFLDWLLAILRDRYRIPRAVARDWLGKDRFVLLLDGLDEVPAEDRARCVEEINEMQRKIRATRMVVCSRTGDYEGIATRLRLQGAVVIRPLTKEQIVAYFTSVSPRLAGVVEALREDPELWELLTSPLMLNIMALAYGNPAAQAVTGGTEPATRRRLLFDAYVVEVLARRGFVDGDVERQLRSVRTLAVASTRLGAGVRVMPLDVGTVAGSLDRAVRYTSHRWVSVAAAAGCATVTGAVMAAQYGAAAGLIVGVGIWGLILVQTFRQASPAATSAPRYAPLVAWSLAFAAGNVIAFLLLRRLAVLTEGQSQLFRAATVVAIGAVLAAASRVVRRREGLPGPSLRRSGLVIWLAILAAFIGVPDRGAIGWVAGFLFSVSCTSLLLWQGVVGVPRMDEAAPGRPPDARWPRYRLTAYLAAQSAVIVIVPVLFSAAGPMAVLAPLDGWILGVVFGVWPGLMIGLAGVAAYARFCMAVSGEPAPWRRSFLRLAVDRSLLVEVDGEYLFIHLLVRDHLAACEPAALARQVERRRAELTA